MSKIAVLAQSLEQPRIVKRIEIYDSVDIYGFTRDIHTVKNQGILSDNPKVIVNIVGQGE